MNERARERLVLAAFVVGCQLVGVSGVLLFPTGETPWYASLNKPSFQPPGWIFGPVWTVLYVLMAIAVWRIWRRPASPSRSRGLVLFGAQLALNAIWTPVFFGAQQPAAALIVLLALWCTLLTTVVVFFREDRPAGALLIPYLAWVSFASVLNGAIVALN